MAKYNAQTSHLAKMVVSVDKAPAKSKACGTQVKANHEVEYGLKVVYRDAKGVFI